MLENKIKNSKTKYASDFEVDCTNVKLSWEVAETFLVLNSVFISLLISKKFLIP
jgi:hypothetical protein